MANIQRLQCLTYAPVAMWVFANIGREGRLIARGDGGLETLSTGRRKVCSRSHESGLLAPGSVPKCKCAANGRMF